MFKFRVIEHDYGVMLQFYTWLKDDLISGIQVMEEDHSILPTVLCFTETIPPCPGSRILSKNVVFDFTVLHYTKRFRHFQILDTWERLWYSVSLFCVLLKDSPSSDWARIWYCTVSHCKVSQCYLTVFIILMISVFTEHVQEFLLLFYSPHR